MIPISNYIPAVRIALGAGLCAVCAVLALDRGATAQPDVAWQRVALSGTGPDRAFHTVVYDPVNDRFVAFGGLEADPESNRFRNDVFTLDATLPDAQWIRLVFGGLAPPPTALHSAVYDPVRQAMLVYGGLTDRSGYGSQQVVDGNLLWSFSLADPDSPAWTREHIHGNPVNRFAHGAVYVPEADAMVVAAGAEAFNDLTSSTYALLLGETPKRWLRLANAGLGLRAGHILVHDGSRLVAYGGLTNFQTPNPTREVVQLDIGSGLPRASSWSRVTTATPGLPRAFMAHAFDPVARLWFVHGGFQTATTILNDLSVLDLGQQPPLWTRTQTVVNGPLTRLAHAAAFDTSRGQAIFQGGSPDNRNTRSDTYQLSIAGLITATPTQPTPGHPTETPDASPSPTATDSSPATVPATATTPITPTQTTTETPTASPTVTATLDPAVTASPTSTPGPLPNHEVDIVEFAFEPDPLEIYVGETVRWQNRDDVAHTTTSGQTGAPDGVWDSGPLATGATFDHTFPEVGTWSYFCRLHPQMQASVIVRPMAGTGTRILLPALINRDP